MSVPERGASPLSKPQFIVVFRERAERNVALLADLRKLKAAKGAPLRSGLLALQAKGGSGAQSVVYERLGIAVTDLEPDELEALRESERVAAVVPNQLRSVPPLLPSAVTDGLADRFISADLEPRESAPNAARLAFLDGISAAVAAMRAFEGAAGVPGAIAPLLRAEAAAARRTWGLAAIGLTGGVQRASGRGVKVAVLDTGVDLHHPDFAGRFREGVNAVSTVPGEGPQDGHGHGTHCCGTIGGPQRSAGGVRYGVAPDAELFAVKVLDNTGHGTDDQILDGIDWAADQGCRVISMSLGAPRAAEEPYSVAYEVVAERLLEEGLLIVAAAGNGSYRPYATAAVANPAACPSILAVAAVDPQLRVAYFSSRQEDALGEVNLSGPGVGVYSAVRGGGFAFLDGTSMAAPHVSGCAALYAELNPKFSARQLRDLLLQRALPLAGDRRDVGLGLVRVP